MEDSNRVPKIENIKVDAYDQAMLSESWIVSWSVTIYSENFILKRTHPISTIEFPTRPQRYKHIIEIAKLDWLDYWNNNVEGSAASFTLGGAL